MERNTDVSYSFTPPSDEEEALEYVKEGDQTIFIGAIGIFDDEWNITPLNSEATKKFGYIVLTLSTHSFDRIEPNFVTRRSELEFAARCTCRISRMLDGGNPQDATAFFISPTLLTAGHVASGKDRILGQKPGKFKAEIADDVFAATTPAADVLKFRTVATLYRGKGRPGSIDINVLKVTSRYRATTWITMDTAARVPKDTTVDLLGYPGDYSQTYLSKLLGITINSDQEWNQIRAIVPAHRLIVSHGKVLEENDRVIYKLSTTGGMSGGPVMYNKKAVGTLEALSINGFRYSLRW